MTQQKVMRRSDQRHGARKRKASIARPAFGRVVVFLVGFACIIASAATAAVEPTINHIVIAAIGGVWCGFAIGEKRGW